MYMFLITGTILFIASMFICTWFHRASQKNLTIKDKMLLNSQLNNLNKYSTSILIAASVLFFAVSRHIDTESETAVFIFLIALVVYILIFAFLISSGINELKYPLKVSLYYTLSKIFLLAGLGVFILSLFLSFSTFSKHVILF